MTLRAGLRTLGLGIAATALVAVLSSSPHDSHATPPAGFFALAGEDAKGFVLPSDVIVQRQWELGALSVQRYQQRVAGADVLGGQITVYRASGDITIVIGAHYRLSAPDRPQVTPQAALDIAAAHGLPAGSRAVTLMLDPATNRTFYRVESRGFDTRPVRWIDAHDGALLKTYDAIAEGGGTGVKSDLKDLAGLTTFHAVAGHGVAGAHYDLTSADGRQVTYDALNRQALLYFVTDPDDSWNLVTADRQSPGQPALVDAQYYAALTDDYYTEEHAFDWLACTGQPAMNSVAHYKKDYDNAFWNGAYVVYGDGDGVSTREYSGELGVVAHELTHAVTDCTSGLIYADESGALNEAFSDIVGANTEFYAAAHGRDPAVAADWLVGEDIELVADAQPGFRNMSDPAEDGDPDHYSERQIGGADNGGVHTNSGIANHAYYLLVNGGQNAGCGRGHGHCTGDGAINVAGIGLAAAQAIFFTAFAALPENATMCQARLATEGVAQPQHVAAVSDAWRAVGLTDAICGAAPVPTATPSPAATNTPTPEPPTQTPTPTATATPDPALDSDGDGCADLEELGGDPSSGGLRDPASAWDFFDVPAPAGPDVGADGKLVLSPSAERNKTVNLVDVGVVLAYVGRAASNPAYMADNNGDTIADGQQLDRSPSADTAMPWQSGPPNGSITIQDVGVALAQVGHTCVFAP